MEGTEGEGAGEELIAGPDPEFYAHPPYPEEHGTCPRAHAYPARLLDETLMLAYLRGDSAAFARLYARLAPDVRSFLLGWVKDRALADDLLQATFLKLHEVRTEWVPGSRVRPLVFGLAVRVRQDAVRRRRRAPDLLVEDAIDALERAPNYGPTPEEDVQQLERGRRVRMALELLPEAHRTVIHLHRFAGMSFAEIARELGVSEVAVRLRAARGYRRLRVLLGDLEGERGE